MLAARQKAFMGTRCIPFLAFESKAVRSMSDTSLSDAIPADAELEQGLRDAVRNAFKRGDNDSITVKRIRATVESKLGLDEGFFKEESAWKEKSKNIIQSEVVSNPVKFAHTSC